MNRRIDELRDALDSLPDWDGLARKCLEGELRAELAAERRFWEARGLNPDFEEAC